MNKYLTSINLKKTLIGLLVTLSITLFLISTTISIAFAEADCYITGNDMSGELITDFIPIEQNAPPTSNYFQYKMVCKKSLKDNLPGKIAFPRPPSPRAPGVLRTSYTELKPSVATAYANINIVSKAPYQVEYQGGIDLFKGTPFSGASVIKWDWIEEEKIEFDITINIVDMQFISDQYGEYNGRYVGGGFVFDVYISDIPSASLNYFVPIQPLYRECRSDMFVTSVEPSTVDFGHINKSDLMADQKVIKEFTLTTHKKDPNLECVMDITPKVTLKSNHLINEHTIGIDNGLMLQIERSDGNRVEFNNPISYKTPIVGNTQIGKTAQTFRAIIQKNPQKEIKTGPFDTTIIYLMEYI